MKVQELFEKQSVKGSYAAVKFDKSTVDALAKYCSDNNIPNAVKPEKFHCTLLYSRKYLPHYEPLGKLEKPLVGNTTGLDVWESQSGSRCLVVEFDCDQLVERHKQLMDEHKATYDFPKYKTHITLSYDLGTFDETKLPDIKEAVPHVEIVTEYGEDLDLDWAAKKATSD